ncbi:ATP synthase F1 [Lasiosphaeria ovina]|uniref:ATP synthase F1 n=1 Tax=Lasiosphaeria ovina TaxID=92902 RepID=A0AAE0K6X0_9PEZI|nr:ATP synthase F1 [Lasiosphaeria ovina]
MSGGLIYNPDKLLGDARNDFVKAAAPSAGDSGVSEKTTKETPVNFWYLTPSGIVGGLPLSTQGFSRMRDPVGAEAVVNVVDGRKKVADDYFTKTDGKYRAIVKLFLLFEQQVSELPDDEAAWPIASGFLIADDIVVTAGHCAFDYSHGLRRLVKVRAYVGYKGHDDLSDTEARWGTAVATTVKWCAGIGDEPADVAFIKLEKPFETVKNKFTCTQTPVSKENADLGVVGYPGDIMDGGERGARMYEMFAATTYNLTTSDHNMLQYKIDTYGGNSGSPVFRDRNSLVAIGVHVLGGYSYNSASVFDGGRYGNRFEALQKTALEISTVAKHPTRATNPDSTKAWLWQVTQTTTEADADLARQLLRSSLSQAQKVVEDIPDKILNAVPSELSFGPEAGPEISILAAAAIATAGRLAADSQSGSHAESLAASRPYDGIIGRALLAEAALQHFSSKALNPNEKKQVEEFMAPVVAGLAPFVIKVAPRLIKGVLEPGLRLLLSRIAGKTTPKAVRSENGQAAELDTGFGRALAGQELDFFDALVKAARADRDSTESFTSALTTFGDFIGSAFKKAGPVLADVAKIGLPLLLGGGGSTTEAAPAATTSLDPLAHRAIVAEACLQSFVQMHTELSSDKREKFFKFLVDRAKVLGPKLVNVAPFAVKLVGPIVADILREVDEKKKADEKRQEFLDFTWGH